MTTTTTKQCPVCKKEITATGGNSKKRVIEKLLEHLQIHRPTK